MYYLLLGLLLLDTKHLLPISAWNRCLALSYRGVFHQFLLSLVDMLYINVEQPTDLRGLQTLEHRLPLF